LSKELWKSAPKFFKNWSPFSCSTETRNSSSYAFSFNSYASLSSITVDWFLL
jgi:hypothetical protein